MSSRLGLALGLLLLVCYVVPTVEASTFLADILVKSKSGATKVQATGASTAIDYHQTELAAAGQSQLPLHWVSRLAAV